MARPAIPAAPCPAGVPAGPAGTLTVPAWQAEVSRYGAFSAKRPGASDAEEHDVRRRGWALGWNALLVVTLGLAAAGCGGGSGPVAVSGAPAPAGEAADQCRALLESLPDSLGDGLDRREVTPEGVSAAAYGKGPVLLTCGAEGVAAGYQPDSDLRDNAGVGWFVETAGEQSRWSTPTRRPQVTLTFPAGVQPFEVLQTLAPAILADTVVTVP
ncbi:DUF3515 family protein [Frankia sp. CN7]|uniref:DUF3515 family protein n=1 Tax=Frankia nepalensis TaxID=1836974 RepID=A0A937RFZ6_9ACTN|nr:DUF3515 family protein [Frankia nepalensis]MBL7510528.1 DUF3515 family protein [Frankia nepalensis]MBL7629497.1 DUF3515 family protein [Frankia nepalensis]